ncbi:LysR family transcriptional regulator [Roseibium salinum]|uniref:LysR family transcriptional regulator n=1 Tax=Roseibium salinum TaxID=1604349 RepID=A0ABT3QY15_9HYPH|nr:LysR family transcriptional regulator [Roseibium sp. DSM 29163]MCX2721821.1 LysR family transcriptional regulator [Roseibium sp. DSM 29163]MDN3720141.1 LysR family transcriptional regulator [Roseibium salinum]
MSRLSEIETFVAIIEAGSLSEASRRSGLALSAVSRRLKELEQRLGATLVRRSTRKISLTDPGHDFYLQCRQILTDLNDAETSLKETTRQLEGRIRMSAPVSFTHLHLSGILAEFLERYPCVELDLELNDRRIDVIEEGYDVVLRLGQLPDSSLRARRLTKIRHVPVAASALLERMGHPESPEDLGRFPCLRYRSTKQSNQWNFLRPDGTEGRVQPGRRVLCNNGDLLTKFVQAGLGIGLEPTFLSARSILEGRLVPLFADHVWSDNAAYLVYPEARPLPLRVRKLIDHMAASLTPEPVWDREIAKRYRLY